MSKHGERKKSATLIRLLRKTFQKKQLTQYEKIELKKIQKSFNII